MKKIKHPFKIAIGLFIGLTAGNLLWEVVYSSYKWGIAAERSYFQFLAIAMYIGFLYLFNRTPASK